MLKSDYYFFIYYHHFYFLVTAKKINKKNNKWFASELCNFVLVGMIKLDCIHPSINIFK